MVSIEQELDVVLSPGQVTDYLVQTEAYDALRSSSLEQLRHSEALRTEVARLVASSLEDMQRRGISSKKRLYNDLKQHLEHTIYAAARKHYWGVLSDPESDWTDEMIAAIEQAQCQLAEQHLQNLQRGEEQDEREAVDKEEFQNGHHLPGTERK